MANDSQLRIIIPQNQMTIRDHMHAAGWPITFELAVGESDPPMMSELNRGVTSGQVEAEVIQIRSIDMLKIIAEERFDVALVGSECVEERYHPRFVELDRFPYGRKWDSSQPRLELCALEDSTVSKLTDIKPGSIIMTERPHVTQISLREKGIESVFEGNHDDPHAVQEVLLENGWVGLREIAGAGPAQLDYRSPDKYFLVMVNESGDTVRDYKLKVIDKLRDIDTIVIAPEGSIANRSKEPLIRQFAYDLREVYPSFKPEIEGSRGSKERL